jgi:hypothetical protein
MGRGRHAPDIESPAPSRLVTATSLDKAAPVSVDQASLERPEVTGPTPDADVIYQWEAGRNKTIRCTITSSRGFRRIDIRQWYEPEDHPGQLFPTKRGINIRADDVDELEDMLDALHRALGTDVLPF